MSDKRSFMVDFKGRIRNFNLPKDKALVPLFEAIVNSLQAIEDKGNGRDGKIAVTVNRLEVLDGDDIPEGDVTGFTITDNGIGFDGPNFESFLKADSQHKEAKGGKGVGRFCWLKAFDHVRIESIFAEGAELYMRKFTFSANSDGIDDEVTEAADTETGTTVELRYIKQQYLPFIPKSDDEIADSIMRHCLVYLLSDDCPNITLIDGETVIDVNAMLGDLLESRSDTVSFHIKQQEFTLLHIKMRVGTNYRSRTAPASKLLLCANNRSVEEESLNAQVLNGLDGWLRTHHEFVYMGVLTGDYLDQNVEATRLSFSFPKSGENLLFDISKEEILTSAHRAIREFLDDYIQEAQDDQHERVERYVTVDAPQYRHLLEYAKDDIAAIKYGADDEAIDDALYKAKRKFDKQVASDRAKLMRKLENGNVSSEDYQQEFMEVIQRASDANKAALADYVAHRKVILDLFERGLELDDSDKYERESYLHELIYPMRSSSDDTAYGAHNLWLIDERLTYSTYISSDLPFGGSHNEQRPDIMCFEQPVFMSTEENHGSTYDSIILFELKRPMRDDYNENDNPIKQLLDYAEKIASNKAKDAKGRYIKVNEHTRMYLYAVCDITPTLARILKSRNFTPTADGEGMFFYNGNYNAYIEVLPFEKILRDSRMRNKVFFRTLGIE